MRTDLPRVSIILPAHNVSGYIGKCIHSLLSQTMDQFELLLIDDASTDHTLQIIDTFPDPRIRLFRNRDNQGTAFSRNVGIEAARGEWLSFVDSDDWCAPDRLERLLEISEQMQADMVTDDLVRVVEGRAVSTILSEHGIYPKGPFSVSRKSFVDMDLGIMKPLIRREIVSRNDLRFRSESGLAHDFEFYLMCNLGSRNHVQIPQSYYFYCCRSDSLSSDNLQVFQDSYITTEKIRGQDRIRADETLYEALGRRLETAKTTILYLELRQVLKQSATRFVSLCLRNARTLIPYLISKASVRIRLSFTFAKPTSPV